MQLTSNDWEWDRSPSFSPDGTQIVFESNRTTDAWLWVMDASGQNQWLGYQLPLRDVGTGVGKVCG